MVSVFNRNKISPSVEGDMQAGVGAILKARRQQLGWSLHDVSKWLKIKESFLVALEEDQLDKLPGTAYVLGFLRSYAKALNLDVANLINQFRSQHQIVSSQPVLHFPVPESERGIPSSIWVALGSVVVIAAYIGWFHYGGGRVSGNVEPADPTNVVVQEKKPEGENISPQIAAIMPDSSGGDVNKPAVPNAHVNEGHPTEAPTNMTPIPLSVTANNAAVDLFSGLPESEVSTEEKNNQEKTANTHPALVLQVKRTAWIKIQDGEKTLLDRLMKRGEVWPMPADYQSPRLSFGPHGGDITVQVEGYGEATLQGRGKEGSGIDLTLAGLKEKDLLKEKTPDDKRPDDMIVVPSEQKKNVTAKHSSKKQAGYRRGGLSQKTSADDLNARQLSSSPPPLKVETGEDE